MDFAYSPRVEELRARVQRFMDDHIVPRNPEWVRDVERGIYPPPCVEELKELAKSEGLWNLFLPALRDVVFDQFFDRKIDFHFALADVRRDQTLLRVDLAGRLDLEHERSTGRHRVIEHDGRVDAVVGEDGTGQVRGADGQILRRRRVAQAHGVDRHLPGAEDARHLYGRAASVVLAVGEHDDGEAFAIGFIADARHDAVGQVAFGTGRRVGVELGGQFQRFVRDPQLLGVLGGAARKRPEFDVMTVGQPGEQRVVAFEQRRLGAPPARRFIELTDGGVDGGVIAGDERLCVGVEQRVQLLLPSAGGLRE